MLYSFCASVKCIHCAINVFMSCVISVKAFYEDNDNNKQYFPKSSATFSFAHWWVSEGQPELEPEWWFTH